MADPVYTRLWIGAIVVTVCVTVVFILWPGVDLAFSTALTDGQGHFLATGTAIPGQISAAFRRGLELAAAASVIYAIWLAVTRRQTRDWRMCWAYVALNLVIGPGVIVNLLLKEHMGRARPANIEQFGGSAQFSGAFRVADQCATNCSFTSGEAALVATWAIVVVSLLWGNLGRRGRRVALLCGGTLVLVGAGLRVGLGRHFLSDAMVSVLISVFVALVLYRVLGIGRARAGFVLPGLGAPARRPR